MRRRGAWVVALLPLLAVPAGLARAQAPVGAGDGGAAAAPVVELILVGGGREAVALLDTVRDLLGRVGLVVEAHAVAAPADAAAISRGSAAARVQVDLRAPDEALILTEGRRQAPKPRTVRRDPSPTVAREELAQAIQSAVESQLFIDPEGHRTAPPEVDGADAAAPAASSGPAAPPPPEVQAPVASAPPPSPPPPPPEMTPAAAPVLAHEAAPTSTRSSVLAVDVSTLAGSGGFASATGPVVALGGDVTVSSRKGWRPSVSLSAREVLPFDGSQDSVTCHASAFAIRALGGLELAHASWVALVAGGGGGADVLSAQPRSATLAPTVLGSATTRGDPIVTAFVAAHVALVPSVDLTLMALGDLDLAPSRYVVVQGTAVDPVLSPWRVRPTFLAGFTFTALGRPAFASREVR